MKNRTNEFIINDSEVIVKFIKGGEFVIDRRDYEKIKDYKWYYHKNEPPFTIINNKQMNIAKLFYPEIKTGFIFKDNNKLNCKRSNIQIIERTNKIIDLNGYNSIYMPEHPRAFNSNGCVYEHILIAEKILGRSLKDEEVVHHKDRNRKNNNPNNLMIFKTDNDHSAYHQGHEAIEENGVWYCLEKKIVRHCKDCGKEIYKTSTYCKDCYNKNHHNKQVEWCKKDKLEELIYIMPFTQIGKMYGVTDSAVRKWCKNYGLPFRKRDINKLILV